MRSKCIGFLMVAMLWAVGVRAETKNSLTGWQKVKLGAVYPIAIHQLPLTTIHEGSHWLTARAFGDRPSIRLLPSYMEIPGDGKRLTLGYIVKHKVHSPVEESLILVAPYAVQLLVVDRTAQWAYGSGRIRIDSFGDKYIQNALLLNEFSPLEDSLFSSDGDFGQLARHLHIPRIVLGLAFQVGYFFSYNSVMNARGHKDSTWAFYIHKKF